MDAEEVKRIERIVASLASVGYIAVRAYEQPDTPECIGDENWNGPVIPFKITFDEFLSRYVRYAKDFLEDRMVYEGADRFGLKYTVYASFTGADLELYQQWLSMFEDRSKIDCAKEQERYLAIDKQYPELPIEQKLLLIISEHGGKSTPKELTLD